MRHLASTTASVALLLGLGLAVGSAPAPAHAQLSIGISVGFAPPELPIYDQPPIPAYGYIWTPGYWAWDDSFGDYYWVPGSWVQPPQVGFLWTPGYWGWSDDGDYVFNQGYWGPTVGFYGGIDYGYGYGGQGYEGGYWQHGNLYYNGAVNNFSSVRINYRYNRPVSHVATVNGVSFNGGAGGVSARPTPAQMALARGRHVAPTALQVRQRTMAAAVPGNRASVSHGKPAIAATSRPAVLKGPGVFQAKAASAVYRAPPAAVVAKTVAAHKARGPTAPVAAARPASPGVTARPAARAQQPAPAAAPAAGAPGPRRAAPNGRSADDRRQSAVALDRAYDPAAAPRYPHAAAETGDVR